AISNVSLDRSALRRFQIEVGRIGSAGWHLEDQRGLLIVTGRNDFFDSFRAAGIWLIVATTSSALVHADEHSALSHDRSGVLGIYNEGVLAVRGGLTVGSGTRRVLILTGYRREVNVGIGQRLPIQGDFARDQGQLVGL